MAEKPWCTRSVKIVAFVLLVDTWMLLESSSLIAEPRDSRSRARRELQEIQNILSAHARGTTTAQMVKDLSLLAPKPPQHASKTTVPDPVGFSAQPRPSAQPKPTARAAGAVAAVDKVRSAPAAPPRAEVTVASGAPASPKEAKPPAAQDATKFKIDISETLGRSASEDAPAISTGNELKEPSQPMDIGGVRVAYGIQTSALAVYQEKVEAQLDTWLSQIHPYLYRIFGPKCSAAKEGCRKTDIWVPTDCNERDQFCKGMYVLRWGHEMVQKGIHFDWLVNIYEDQYVLPNVLQKELAKYDHKKPMVLGAYGCGQLWRYKPESKDGKIPKPSFWVEPSPPSCELVQKNAGLCGGYGVWYSVGAINQLIAREHGSMQEFDTIWRKYPPTIQVDTGTSCILLESGVQIKLPNQIMQQVWEVHLKDFPNFKVSPNDARTKCIYHLVGGKDENVPASMRYVHRMVLQQYPDLAAYKTDRAYVVQLAQAAREEFGLSKSVVADKVKPALLASADQPVAAPAAPADSAAPLVNSAQSAPSGKACDNGAMYIGKGKACGVLCGPAADEPVHIRERDVHYACQSFWYEHFATIEECEKAVAKERKALAAELCDSTLCATEEPPEIKAKTGRGLVFTGGRGHWYLIKSTIRRFDLPKSQIEVFVDSEQDLSECGRTFGGAATCRAPRENPRILPQFYAGKKYTYKPVAVLDSSFAEVLFMDADINPLLDPRFLFDTCEFKTTGAVFFPDLFGAACESVRWGAQRALSGQSGWPGHAMWSVINHKWSPEWPLAQEFESGLFVVDTKRHWRALRVSKFLTESATVQNTVYGDKEAFKFGFLAARSSFTLGPDAPSQLFSVHLPGPKSKLSELTVRDSEKNPEWHRVGELQQFRGSYVFAHHLPRPAAHLFDQAPKRPLLMSVPVDRAKLQAPYNYSYCNYAYDGYHQKAFLKEGRNTLHAVPKAAQTSVTWAKPPSREQPGASGAGLVDGLGALRCVDFCERAFKESDCKVGCRVYDEAFKKAGMGP